MIEQPEPEGRLRTRGDSSPQLPWRGSAETIKAVSGLLNTKKALLDRPSSPAKVNLADVARPLGEIDRRFQSRPSPRSNIETSSISLDPTHVKLPLAMPADRPRNFERPHEERDGIEASAGDYSSPSVAANVGSAFVGRGNSPALASAPLVVSNGVSTSVGRDIPRASHSVSKPAGSSVGVSEPATRPEDRRISGPQIAPPPPGNLLGVEVLLDPPRIGEHRHHPGDGLALGFAARSELASVGGAEPPGERTAIHPALLADAVGPVDLPRERGGSNTTPDSRNLLKDRGDGAKVSHSGIIIGHRLNPAISAEPLMSLVRNPLSSDLRDFSMARPLPEGGSGTSSERAGMRNSGENAFGQANSQHGGTPVDLSKTNELLQQLIDVVRKQRGSSLTIGGPSVYTDR